MTKIKVYRPEPALGSQQMPTAERRPVEAGAVLTLVENGKPQARHLLLAIAEELRARLPIGDVQVLSKPSAIRTLAAEEASVLAAKSRLILTGVGD